MKNLLKRTKHWIVLLLLTDAIFIFVTWIIRPETLKYLIFFFLLFTILMCFASFFAEYHCQNKDKEKFLHFLETPDNKTKKELLQRFGNNEVLETFCMYIFEQTAQINEKTIELTSYREYIEAWVHEVKTPLSLSTLVLHNHKEEMSPYVYARMHYIHHQIAEDVERILFYARLQTDHVDYKFTPFYLDECIQETLEDYQLLMEERKMKVDLNLSPLMIISDRKVVSFMLSQLIGNAVKYADSNKGIISLVMQQEKDNISLCIYNNGEGVPSEDKPFIFDKGFTGNHPNRQKATGMGLYLVRKYAEKICAKVQLETDIPFSSGFGIKLIFTL